MKKKQRFGRIMSPKVAAFLLICVNTFVLSPTSAHAATCSPIVTSYTGDGTNGTLNLRYNVYTFTTVGTCDWSVPSNTKLASFLVVGGGGGGGSWVAGGGGGGGVVESLTATLTSGANVVVVVGNGGTKSSTTNSAVGAAGNGGQSSFGSTIAYGGGAGATWTNAPGAVATGGGGGSGSGGSVNASIIPAQGFAGGTGTANSTYGYPAGGGGGAGGPGGNGSTTKSGDGGIGKQSYLSGAGNYYGGGGGAGLHGNGTYTPSQGLGGLGGGGNGDDWISVTHPETNGSPGADNTGGGGGGGGGPHVGANSNGGNGGSGIVIARIAVGASISQSLGTGSLSSTIAPYRKNVQLQVVSPVSGSLNFYQSGKIIAGCRRISVAAGATATCTWKPSKHGPVDVRSDLFLSGSTVLFARALNSFFVQSRTGYR